MTTAWAATIIIVCVSTVLYTSDAYVDNRSFKTKGIKVGGQLPERRFLPTLIHIMMSSKPKYHTTGLDNYQHSLNRKVRYT